MEKSEPRVLRVSTAIQHKQHQTDRNNKHENKERIYYDYKVGESSLGNSQNYSYKLHFLL